MTAIIVENINNTMKPNSKNTNQNSTDRMHVKHQESWMSSKEASQFVTNMLTCLYALILTTFAFIIDLTPVNENSLWKAEKVFTITMNAFGIVFFLFLNIFLIHPQVINYCTKILGKWKVLTNAEKWHMEPCPHNGEGASTLYLRLGALFFGSAALMLLSLEIGLQIHYRDERDISKVKYALMLTFIFIQMHFLCRNTQITVTRFKTICKLGFMHLVTLNIWNWFRFVLAKQVAKASKKFASNNMEQLSLPQESGDLGSVSEAGHEFMNHVVTITPTNVVDTLNTTAETVVHNFYSMMVIQHFNDLSTFLITCIVEYSLVGAAVMFIIWRSIDKPQHKLHVHVKNITEKHKIGKRLSNSTFGLFGGIVFLIASLISMGVYMMFEKLEKCESAYLTLGIVDISLFSIMLVACLLGFVQMRKLQYRLHPHGESIDEILLIIGLTGELVYCVIGIDIFIEDIRTSTTGKSLLPVFVFVVRLLQVASQTAFILIASRLRCLSSYAIRYQPGKQVITFLLVCNLALFGFHTFESMKHPYGISDNASLLYLQVSFSMMPLLVFFRFHSSACLAEIWKVTYSTKEQQHLTEEHHGTSNDHYVEEDPIVYHSTTNYKTELVALGNEINGSRIFVERF